MPDHYVPRGPRAQWTRAQYEVYKEEQSQWREAKLKERNDSLAKAAKQLVDDRFSQPKFVTCGRTDRYCYAVIKGRREGEPAVAKDDNGMPVPEAVEAQPEDCTETVQETANPEVEITAMSKSSDNHSSIWMLPETDTEMEPIPTAGASQDKSGKWVLHDYWPSVWRSRIADVVCEVKINKTVRFSMRRSLTATGSFVTIQSNRISINHAQALPSSEPIMIRTD